MHDTLNPFHASQAQLRYLDNDFKIIKHGDYVPCAITGHRILLRDLEYWSVARQEAYVDVRASLEAELRAREKTASM